LSPAAEYRSRLDRSRLAFDECSRRDVRLAAARLIVFAAAVVVAALAWGAGVSGWWLSAPAGIFLGLVVWHDRALRDKERAAAAIAFYEHGLARIEDRWTGMGSTGEAFHDERHPYEADLDLFGRGSLFELLSLARTQAGEGTLAGWLKSAAEPGEVRVRQDAVRELTPALDLREHLAASAAAARRQVESPQLLAWAGAPPALEMRLRIVPAAITVATLIAAASIPVTGDGTALLVMLGVQSAFALPFERRVRGVLHGADGPARSLTALAPTLKLLEREPFAAPRLKQLLQRIEGRGVPASTAVARLVRLVEMHDWQHNVVFAPIGLVLLWGTHLAWAIEAWRRDHGDAVASWLESVGEFEALSSLAAYAYEHPADPYPTIVPPAAADSRAATFEAAGIGHPLLPAARMVRNDVHLSAPTRVLVVSGSNMSGKSTLLRTVGVNAVLAQMGAPVRAASLQLSPLRVGATLRVQDSLQQGRSRFYAEITRVRELTDIARGPVPLLFLLDELFHGTNSHDRLAGATGVLQALVGLDAIGLVTTHDMALAAMADALGGAAVNIHFEDWFEDGEIRFDYRIKPGPVARSNALALMRAVGLDVGEKDG
jgi:hypothetical protein